MITTVGTSSLVAEKFGSGDTQVLALHGWGRNGADFARILAPHNGLALHLPGFGPAPEPPTAWSSADYAREIAQALEGMGPRVLELSCEKEPEKKVSLLSSEVVAVQVYEKSASGGGGKRPGFSFDG